MRILLIEDDSVLGGAVRDQIAGDGHSLDWVQRLDAADSAVSTTDYDLILLDLMLPDGLGIPFLRRLRTRSIATPVIILTALDQVSDRIEGLNAGAFGESLGALLVAGVIGGDSHSRIPQRHADRFADAAGAAGHDCHSSHVHISSIRSGD